MQERNSTADIDQALADELKTVMAAVKRRVEQARDRAHHSHHSIEDQGRNHYEYSRIYQSQWWDNATGADAYHVIHSARSRAAQDPEAARALEYLEEQFRIRYGVRTEDFLGYLHASGRDERALQRNEEEIAQRLENISDSEYRKALHSHDPHESAEHQAADYQAHTDAAEHWDKAEQREERAVYYENRFDRETAQSMTLTDKSLGVHPHQALKQAKPAHQQQKPARQGRTQNIRRQRELSR